MTTLIQWLIQERHLDASLLNTMGIKEITHDRLGHAVVFPYIKNNKPYAGKFRTKDKKFSSSKGISRGLYNEDCLRENKDQPIVITEGEIDAISCIQSGFTRTVSVPDGWTQQGNKIEALVEAENLLTDAPYIIVANDTDEAGESLPRAVNALLRSKDVRYVTWPKGCKDANDVLINHGVDILNQCLSNAKSIDPDGGIITGFSDLPPLSARRLLHTGQEWLDEFLCFELGAISVLTGTPGTGKSTFSNFLAYHIASHENARVGLIGFETHPHRTRDHFARLDCSKKFDELIGMERSAFLERCDKRFRIVHRTYDKRVQHSIGWLEEIIYALSARDNCKMIIIDPWNELEHLPEKGESLTNYVNWALLQIRLFAERFDVHIMVVAHPRKMSDPSKAPTGYDVADSAAFYNKPSLGITVHNYPVDSGYILGISTWKVRDSQLYGFYKSATGSVFDRDMMTYKKHGMVPE